MDLKRTLDVASGASWDGEAVVYFAGQDEEGEPELNHLPDLPEKVIGDFDAGKDDTQWFYEGDFAADRLMVLGLGKTGELDSSDMTERAGTVVKKLNERSLTGGALVFPLFLDMDREELARELHVGLGLGSYEFTEYQHEDEEKQEKEDETELESVALLLGDRRSHSTVERGFNQGRSLTEGVGFTRNLGNTPANVLTPLELASRAREIEDQYDTVSVTVWEREKLEEEEMNLLLGVGKGSQHPPCLIRVDYEPGTSRGTVGLAGKGVTFDTGGISIKPSKDMDQMKFDMCGAAAVLGIVRTAADLNLPVTLRALVPAAENMPGESAVKPGDIITGYHGKSVEILNTDAEGRLILADALGYISKELGEELDCLIDYATLTGACITALGHEAAGLMGNDDPLCEQLTEAGEQVQERVWRLPLWKDHSEQMDSKIADVKNIGGDAGAITAGAFLREFVDEDVITEWAHLDIAGTGWGMKELSYRPSGATGFGVRLTTAFLGDRFGWE